MPMQVSALGKKDYQLLGKTLVKQRPDVAQELYAIYCTSEPYETDLSRIPSLFRLFCEIKGISPDHISALGKYEGKHFRSLFVSAVLHLYKPEIFSQPIGSIVIIGGISTVLKNVLNYSHRSAISRTIRDAVADEKNYDDYRAEVETIVELLKGKGV